LFVESFGAFLTHMIGLNLLDNKICRYVKTDGWAKGAIQHTESELTDKAALASLRYFIQVLNYSLWGRRTRDKRYSDVCRILAIPSFEGTNNGKRRHFHILLGNVPADKMQDLEKYVADAWAQTKWGMPGVHVQPLYDESGAAFYTGKEVGFCNDDAMVWEFASIPRRLVRATA